MLSVSYQDSITFSKARRAFWLARFARLYPAYLLSYLLFVPMAVQKYMLNPAPELSASAHKTFFAGAVLFPLLLQAWTSVSQAWNGPGWSVSVEAFFYFLFPYTAFRLMRQSTRVAATISVTLWVASLPVIYTHVSGHLSTLWYHSYIQYHPLFWTPCFVAGIVIARFAAPWQRVSGALVSTITLLTLAGIILICALSQGRYREFVITTGLLPLLALLIVCCCHESSRIVKLIGSSPIYELGTVSYVTYIIQAPVWHLVTVATERLVGYNLISRQVATWQFPVFLPILLGASFFVSRYVERPARTWIMRGWGTRSFVAPSKSRGEWTKTILHG